MVYDEELYHYGVGHLDGGHSGRYPWGSGENPNQHQDYSLLDTIKLLKKDNPGIRVSDWTDEDGVHHTGLASMLGMSPTELTNRSAYLREQQRNAQRAKIVEFRSQDPPMGWSDIAKAFSTMYGGNWSESTIRTKYNSIDEGLNNRITNAASRLRDAISDRDYPAILVGPGTAQILGVTQTKLDAAIQMLKDEGYGYFPDLHVPQAMGTKENTTLRVLTAPTDKNGQEFTLRDLWLNRGELSPVESKRDPDGDYHIGGAIQKPAAVDSSRVAVRYAEDGGSPNDGLIEIRPGVPDLNLGDAMYAQVRINVDDTHYLKGVAMYSDDIPDGYDIVFDTGKSKEEYPDKMKVFKKLKTITEGENKGEIDWKNPFGSSLQITDGKITGQSEYIDPKTGEVKLSAINKCREEGEWEEWGTSRTVSAQFLSKQDEKVAKRQLDLDIDARRDELADIMMLQNPEIKKKLLNEYADNCDAAAYELKAAGFPGQSTKVLLPLSKMKEGQCYCPSYDTGTEVILIRYPHGGIFEIPVLTVNNEDAQGKRLLGGARDAIGVNKPTLDQLSGADTDGDTVMVIPTFGQNFKTSKPLKELVGFDPKEQYKIPETSPLYGTVGLKSKEVNDAGMAGDGFNKQMQMGMVTNLITDMAQQAPKPPEKPSAGASKSEWDRYDQDVEAYQRSNAAFMAKYARAVKHSMVIIDAEKHQLNWKASEEDNQINELKREFQMKDNGKFGGASTLISKASATIKIDQRTPIYDPYKRDKDTGEYVYTDEERARWEAGEQVYRPSGKTYKSGKPKQETVHRMEAVQDASELLSANPTQMELIYMDYANSCKALANEARKEVRTTPNTELNPSARKVYAAEVASLNAKIDKAMTNKPYETEAQTLAHAIYTAREREHKDEWTNEQKKKARAQAIVQARQMTGANKREVQIDITDREWEAMLSGAISSNKINQIINNTDEKKFKERALPRDNNRLTPAKIARIKHLVEAYRANPNQGSSYAVIAKECGVSESTVQAIAAGKM